MGIAISINGMSVEAIDYTVTESASPLSAGDSRGGVGSIVFTIPEIDPDTPSIPGGALAKLKTIGLASLKGAPVKLVDDRRGVILGVVTDASKTSGSGTYSVTCETRLRSLNIYGVQAQPYVGTLHGAFEYYLGIAGVDTDIQITDVNLAARPVSYPGWYGDLWHHLKMLATAEDADIALVSGVILMRPVRERLARINRTTGVTFDLGAGNLALAVEVYQYNNRQIVGEMIWPPGDLDGEDQVFSVNAGEVTEYALELSSSLSSLVQPSPEDWVSPYEMSASVYSVMTNDGQKVPAAKWKLHGGSVLVIPNEDTKSARLIIRGAEGLSVVDPSGEKGESREATSFSLAEYSDGTTGRRSSLRILGSGVAFSKTKVTIPTGVSPSLTENLVGITIDNPFMSTAAEVYRAGTRAALEYSGINPSLKAEVISVNRKGDSGNQASLTYGEVDAHFKALWGSGVTYGGVRSGLQPLGITTYAKLDAYILSISPHVFESQVFGNVAGARFFDKETRRWWRIRRASILDGAMSIEADNDLLYSDVLAHFASLTYSEVNAIFSGMTYEEATWAGLYG